MRTLSLSGRLSLTTDRTPRRRSIQVPVKFIRYVGKLGLTEEILYKYFKGDLSIDSAHGVSSKLVDLVSTDNPDWTIAQCEDLIMDSHF